MKKFLSLFTMATMLSSTAIPTTLTVSNGQIEKLNLENWVWEHVTIKHSVETSASGTDWQTNITSDTRATSQNWVNFANTKQIIANGYFALHTYDGAVYLNNVVLNIKTNKPNENIMQWDWSKTNDVWQGWGHQTSTLTLTLTAKYNDSENLTSIEVDSYVSARTAGSVHECSTTSQVNTLTFVIT